MSPKAPWKSLEWVNTYGPIFKMQLLIFKMQLLDMWSVVVTDPHTITSITKRTSRYPSLLAVHC